MVCEGQISDLSYGCMRQMKPGRLLRLAGVWLLLTAVIMGLLALGPPEIKVEWATETEHEIAGFNIYRSESAEGDFVQINDAFIPGQGDALTGASYTYRDHQIVPGQPYFYRLEKVSSDNARQMVELGSSQATAFDRWGATGAAVAGLAGLLLIAARHD